METKSLKTALVLVFAGFILSLVACDRPVNFRQLERSGKLETPEVPVDPEEPTEPVEAKSVIINNQDAFTTSTAVSLKLDAVKVTDMYITENADCSTGGQWEKYSTTKSWNLKKSNQNVVVYAKFKSFDYETGCVHDDITHDDKAPNLQITSAPPASIKDFEAYYAFTASDSGSGLKSVTCAFDENPAVDCANTVVYRNLAVGNHQLKILALDKAGNLAEAKHSFAVTENRQNQVITIGNSTGKADILFIVNNSFSMFSELRGPVTERFTSFISNLKDTDYNIAVTSGDARGSKAYEAGGFADLLRSAVPGTGLVVVPRNQVVTPSTKSGEKLFVTTLMRPESICVQVSTAMCPPNGSAYQESIHSSLLAFDRPENQSFFRTDASLHLVIISDSDEGAGNLTDRNGNILDSTPAHNRPETLIKTVKSRWPQKEFKVHSVIKPKNKICNAFEVQANNAPIYQALTEKTGGKIADICNEMDYTETNAIANAIATTKPVFKLTCDPVDVNKDGKVDAADINVSYSPAVQPLPAVTLNGRNVSFNPLPKPNTQVRLSYVCP